MAERSELTRHIESYVGTSCSPAQQAASVDAIASLLKTEVLTVEVLVREMGMYLTTTDFVIRARGILLLAEILSCLASKPLDGASVHSLIEFFTNRLADWRALRGALLGCLALMRRKNNVGSVTSSDAKALAQSFLKNIQVQSLGQHDRKLCFELLGCLLDLYPDAVTSLGDDFVLGICGAIDEEKDPQCLMLVFHLVEVLVQVFPEPSGPIATCSGELFEILGSYFPIHYTHPESEGVNVKRDDLSRALMLAFSSNPCFEPYVIPLLLEKLSSSLQSAKLDSLKYLCHCAVMYGAEKMARHTEAIWSLLKETIYKSPQKAVPSFDLESVVGLGFQDNEVATEALKVLEELIILDNGLFTSLIVNDKDINEIFSTITLYKTYGDIPFQCKQHLHAVGRIFFISTRAIIASSNRMFEKFFPPLMDILGLSAGSLSCDKLAQKNNVIPERLNFGALYLCTELIAACRDLVTNSKEIASSPISVHQPFFIMLKGFSERLVEAFCSFLAKSTTEDFQDAEIYYKVKGLQILATFPEDYCPISSSSSDYILLTLISTIIINFERTFLWRLALKSLAHIGSFIDKSDRALSYTKIVVEKVVSLVSNSDQGMPLLLKLEVAADIGTSGSNYMLKIVHGLEEAVYANLYEIYANANANAKRAETVVHLLECYSNRVLPWLHESGLDELLMQFAVNIWNQIEDCSNFSFRVQESGLLDAMMMAMKLAVGSCSEERQNEIIYKSFSVLSSRNSLWLNEFRSSTVQFKLEGVQVTADVEKFSSKDEWILLLFVSVIIGIHPQTKIPKIRQLLNLFLTTVLKGYVSAAQALGSMINKMGNRPEVSSDCTLEEAVDTVLKTLSWKYPNEDVSPDCGRGNGSENGHGNVSRSCQVHAIVGLAWVGKGLLLRGHEKIKDVSMFLLECLLSNGGEVSLPSKQSPLGGKCERDSCTVIKCAADAFGIIMSDSEACLNRRFHAIIRPLYKQRFFSIMMPILQSLIFKSDSLFLRSILYRASVHIISETPSVVIVGDAKKLIPIILDSLSMLSKDKMDKDTLYSLLLVFSGILMDKNGEEVIKENAHIIIECLTGLIAYPHMTIVRETAIQCLIALSVLPHSRIYPMRKQVLRTVSRALDDPKRAVRQEAVRCQHAWASIA